MHEDDFLAGAEQPAAVVGGGFKRGRHLHALPLADVAVQAGGERGGQRAEGCRQGGVVAFAEADGEHELSGAGRGRAAAREVDLAHEGNVAVGGRAVLPVHAEIVLEILPAVAGADKAAGSAGEAAGGGHGERVDAVPGKQGAGAGDVDNAGRVACAAAAEMRREQGVQVQAVEQRGVGFETDADEYNRRVRVADGLFGERIAAVGVAIDLPRAGGGRVDVGESADGVALFLVEEGSAIGDEEAHVAGLRAVDGGVVDFVKDAVRGGEPDPG